MCYDSFDQDCGKDGLSQLQPFMYGDIQKCVSFLTFTGTESEIGLDLVLYVILLYQVSVYFDFYTAY